MYIKIEENLYKKISAITMTDYDKQGDCIPVDSIEPMLKDLLYAYDHLQEEIEDLQKDVEDNYKPVSKTEQYDMDDRYFIETL